MRDALAGAEHGSVIGGLARLRAADRHACSFNTKAIHELRTRGLAELSVAYYADALDACRTEHDKDTLHRQVLTGAACAGDVEFIRRCEGWRADTDPYISTRRRIVAVAKEHRRWAVLKYVLRDGPAPISDEELSYSAAASSDAELAALAAKRPTEAWLVALEAAHAGDVSVLRWLAARGWRPAERREEMMRAYRGATVRHVAVARWFDEAGLRDPACPLLNMLRWLRSWDDIRWALGHIVGPAGQNLRQAWQYALQRPSTTHRRVYRAILAMAGPRDRDSLIAEIRSGAWGPSLSAAEKWLRDVEIRHAQAKSMCGVGVACV